MSDVFDDNNDNEDIEFANREWNKLNKSLQKDGFKDGIHEGRETGLQKAFDLGYKLSFDPFLTISSFEAIIDVLVTNTEHNDSDDHISTQFKTIKTDIRKLYELTENHLLSLEANHLDSNTTVFKSEITDLFENTKQNAITICSENNFESILQLIKDLSLKYN